MSEWKEAEFGFIPYDWQAIRFKEILKIPLRNGVNKPSRIRGNGDYKMVNMNEIFAHDVIVDIPMEFVDLSRKEKETSLLEKHDLLFARQSLVFEGAGKCSIYLGDNEKVCFEGHLIRARLNKQKANPEFYYYFFSSSYGKRFLRTIVEQAVVAGIRGSDLNELEIPYAPKTQQDGAVKLLSCLDRKIENLRRQNETLEKIAQTLFKHWFVDFEFPNAEGQPYKSSGGEMVPSELGDIPAGWCVEPLDQVADFLNGLALQKYPPIDNQESLPVIKIREMKSGVTASTDRASLDIPSQYIIDNGDVLFSWSGSLEIVVWCFGKGALNQHLFKVSSKKYPKWFYYLWTLEHLTHFRAIAKSKATTMGHIQRKHLSEAFCLVPPESQLSTINATIQPIFQKNISNSLQIQALTQTRDTLLPKLMSGQLRINE